MRIRVLLVLASVATVAAVFAQGTPLGAAPPLLRSILGACATPTTAGVAHCNLHVRVDARNRPLATTAPAGYGAADLAAAYKLPVTSGGSGQTIAVVDAYDDKSAEADLGVYRSQMGLAPCTTANGCFKKVNQNGVQGSYPANNVGWALEVSLDLDMVSAACPLCHILLVEANDNNDTNLYSAVDTAVRLGANVVSNSYGSPEASTDPANNVHFSKTGVVFTVSSGDSGYGVQYPAAAPSVVSVGGTTLTRNSSARGFGETAWKGAGSGCSQYETKPTNQTDTGCSKRTVADVSSVADPNTGVAVYDSNCTALQQFLGSCLKGWGIVGGTSAGAPLIAGVYGLAGNASTAGAAYPYSHAAGLFDVTSGSNGSCGGSYLCTAAPGYDGPTGLGTPNGTAAF
jgi:subtilase family serine protease